MFNFAGQFGDSSDHFYDIASAIARLVPRYSGLGGFWCHKLFDAGPWPISQEFGELTPLQKTDKKRDEDREETVRKKIACAKEAEREKLKGVTGSGEDCAPKTVSNYIQSVKPSITLRLACLSSSYSSKCWGGSSHCRKTLFVRQSVDRCGHKSSAQSKPAPNNTANPCMTISTLPPHFTQQIHLRHLRPSQRWAPLH